MEPDPNDSFHKNVDYGKPQPLADPSLSERFRLLPLATKVAIGVVALIVVLAIIWWLA